MFCEYCGRKLNQGEICSCPKAQDEFQKMQSYKNTGRNNEAFLGKDAADVCKREGKFNGLAVISFAILAVGGWLVYYLNFTQDNLVAKIKVLDKYQMYITYIIPTIVFLAGGVVACISLRNKIFRKGSIVSLTLNLLLGGVVVTLMFWNQYKVESFMEKVTAVNIDRESLKKYYDTSIEKNGALKEKTLQKINTQIDSIIKAFEDENISLQEAQEQLENIKKIGIAITESDSAIEKIGELQRSRDAFANAGEYEKKKDYKNALIQYQQVLQEDMYYEAAQENVNNIRKTVRDDAKNTADALLGENKYAEAFQTIDKALDILETDETLERMQSDNEDKYVDYVITQVDTLIVERKISDAEKLLIDAKGVVERNEISNKLDELSKYKPINLSELRVIDYKNAEISKGLSRDSYGNEYNDALIMNPYYRDDPADIYLNLDGRYNILKGIIAPHEEMRSESGDDPCRFKVEIYADGNLVYTSNEFTKTTAPDEFTVNINNAKVVQIRSQHINKYSGGIRAIIGNVKFSNE